MKWNMKWKLLFRLGSWGRGREVPFARFHWARKTPRHILCSRCPNGRGQLREDLTAELPNHRLNTYTFLMVYPLESPMAQIQAILRTSTMKRNCTKLKEQHMAASLTPTTYLIPRSCFTHHVQSQPLTLHPLEPGILKPLASPTLGPLTLRPNPNPKPESLEKTQNPKP